MATLAEIRKKEMEDNKRKQEEAIKRYYEFVKEHAHLLLELYKYAVNNKSHLGEEHKNTVNNNFNENKWYEKASEIITKILEGNRGSVVDEIDLGGGPAVIGIDFPLSIECPISLDTKKGTANFKFYNKYYGEGSAEKIILKVINSTSNEKNKNSFLSLYPKKLKLFTQKFKFTNNDNNNYKKNYIHKLIERYGKAYLYHHKSKL